MLDLWSLGGVIQTKVWLDVIARTLGKKKRKKKIKENNRFIM